MNSLTVLIGVLCISFGLYTLYARVKWPQQFSKLAAMKARWGKKAGTLIHTIAYSGVPIWVGITFIKAGFHGVSLLDFISTN